MRSTHSHPITSPVCKVSLTSKGLSDRGGNSIFIPFSRPCTDSAEARVSSCADVGKKTVIRSDVRLIFCCCSFKFQTENGASASIGGPLLLAGDRYAERIAIKKETPGRLRVRSGRA